MDGGRSWDSGRLRELLGVEHPIVQGPFGGGLSTVRLAAAVADAGGLGSYGAHILRPAEIGALVAELRAATTGPFAVNLWVPQPDEAGLTADAGQLARHAERLRPFLAELGVAVEEPQPAPDFAEQVEALLAAGPPVASFVMGVPPRWVVERARRNGIVTVGTATTAAEAVALEAAGLDAVVASGSDAGGHRGSWLRPVRESLVGTFALVPQVVDAVSVPVIAAGGIADGRGVAAALALGADGVQVGTGFLATEESGASDVHRAALHGPEAATTVLTRLFSGRLARGIPNRLVRTLAAYEDEVPPYPLQNALMLPVRRAAAARGDGGLVNLWAGQAAALTRPRTAREYLAHLLADTDRVLARS
ncbi:NAD(P)H-dependent flavin oxidoreductase [Kitasatospora hibisci]|uniref:NAD(P)H-dependent flavin oxidoreductase n=1 Tax=Kitasatospora hibisci TaxID=3369522 RepID=UPI0037553A9B